jgi:Arc/MetJ-type ribon-helix-helix transcriptional regulator
METVVRFEGMVEKILNELVASGYFKTKSEALRAGILELGKEYHIIDDLRSDLAHAEEIDRKIKSGEMKLASEREFRAIIKRKKSE